MIPHISVSLRVVHVLRSIRSARAHVPLVSPALAVTLDEAVDDGDHGVGIFLHHLMGRARHDVQRHTLRQERLQRIGLSQSALSQHLAILRSDGLVKTRRQAQSIFYSLASETAITLLDNVQTLFSGTSGHYSDGNVEHVDFRQQSNQSR